MARVMCIWFPRWPIQRVWNERPELRNRAVALFHAQNSRPTIGQLSAQLERLGIRTGQPLAEARALVPGALFLPSDAAGDRAALVRLALECQRFSPLVGLEEGQDPESLIADVSGCTHLWNGEERFLQAVVRYLGNLCYYVHVSITNTPCAAWAIAHTCRYSVVSPGREHEALAGLPVWSLRLPLEILERLEALGILTLGQVLALPRPSLFSRFGAILPERLDQSIGLLPETIEFVRLKDPIMVMREWEVPVEDRLTLSFLCRVMLAELIEKVGQSGRGIHELEYELKTETGPILIPIRLVEPSVDEAHLAQLVDLQFERLTWSVGVMAARISATRLGSIEQTQRSFLEGGKAEARCRDLSNLVDRLRSRLDPGAVFGVEIVPDSQPEFAFRLSPWAKTRLLDKSPFSPEDSRLRPTRILKTPIPIEVTAAVPDGRPIRMIWNEDEERVERCWGPERIATGWWRAHDIERDYYRVEWQDGHQVWVYRDLRGGRWYLHGFFD